MKRLKKLTKMIFYKWYHIKPPDVNNSNELLYACEGRIIRSLSNSPKKFCGAYILNGLESKD